MKEMRTWRVRHAGRPAVFGMLLCVVAAWAGADDLQAVHRLAAAEASVRRPAPAEVVREIQAALDRARVRFEARDASGVLTHVSEQYRTGPMTKAEIRQQLLAIYEIYTAVQAHVAIDAVELVDGGAWVYTTGEISGRLPLVGAWMTILSWERELEVARREGKSWRLFGYQQ